MKYVTKRHYNRFYYPDLMTESVRMHLATYIASFYVMITNFYSYLCDSTRIGCNLMAGKAAVGILVNGKSSKTHSSRHFCDHLKLGRLRTISQTVATKKPVSTQKQGRASKTKRKEQDDNNSHSHFPDQ